MILEIDVGNSRVKCRAVRDGQNGNVQFFSHQAIESSDEPVLAALAGAKRIKVSSVADSLKPALEQVASAMGASIEFAEPSKACAGVTNSYADPKLMGVDRWLAMLAAYNADPTEQPCVVIDSGTSLTIDFVASGGQHLGGLILPGKQLLLDSLARRTEKVLFDPELSNGELKLGRSTQEAVLNGSVYMMVGAVHQAIESAGLSEECRYYLCGGDAALLQHYLNLEANVVPDLVLDGLRYSLP